MPLTRRRLVLVNGWFLQRPTTGSGQYLTSLLREFPILQTDVRLRTLVPVPPDLAGSWTPSPDLPDGMEFLPVPLPPGPEPLAKIWWEQAALPLQCLRHRAALLWNPYWTAPLWNPVPVAVTVHDVVPLLRPEYRRHPRQRAYLILNLLGLRQARAVITVSHAGVESLHRHVPEFRGEVAVALNGASSGPAVPPDPARIRELRSTYGLPEQFFLYLGGFERRKNVAAILKAYRRYLNLGGNPAIKLVLAGRLPDRDTAVLQHPVPLIRDLALDGQVLLTDRVDEAVKWDLYHMALAFLFPGLAEGFGLPVAEAMQAGTPVVTSRY